MVHEKKTTEGHHSKRSKQNHFRNQRDALWIIKQAIEMLFGIIDDDDLFNVRLGLVFNGSCFAGSIFVRDPTIFSYFLIIPYLQWLVRTIIIAPGLSINLEYFAVCACYFFSYRSDS